MGSEGGKVAGVARLGYRIAFEDVAPIALKGKQMQKHSLEDRPYDILFSTESHHHLVRKSDERGLRARVSKTGLFDPAREDRYGSIAVLVDKGAAGRCV